MLGLFLHSSNMPFSIALVLMFMIGLLEIISTGGASGILDNILPDTDFDFDADSDIEIPALSKVLGWLKAGKVPALIYFVILIFIFSMFGLMSQSFVKNIIGHYLPGWIAVWPALFVALFTARGACALLGKVVIKDETSAINIQSFVGKIAVIINGTAKKNLPARAKLIDIYGTKHYINVIPDEDKEYPRGTQILIVEQVKGSTFKVIENTNKRLMERK